MRIELLLLEIQYRSHRWNRHARFTLHWRSGHRNRRIIDGQTNRIRLVLVLVLIKGGTPIKGLNLLSFRCPGRSDEQRKTDDQKQGCTYQRINDEIGSGSKGEKGSPDRTQRKSIIDHEVSGMFQKRHDDDKSEEIFVFVKNGFFPGKTVSRYHPSNRLRYNERRFRCPFRIFRTVIISHIPFFFLNLNHGIYQKGKAIEYSEPPCMQKQHGSQKEKEITENKRMPRR